MWDGEVIVHMVNDIVNVHDRDEPFDSRTDDGYIRNDPKQDDEGAESVLDYTTHEDIEGWGSC